MSDEPSLPRMPPPPPPATATATAAGPGNDNDDAAAALLGPARKRVRLAGFGGAGAGLAGLPGLSSAQLLLNSSDPAVFSSDDDPTLDNYARPDAAAAEGGSGGGGGGGGGGRRTKRRYVGAWYAQQPAAAGTIVSSSPTRTVAVRTARPDAAAVDTDLPRPRKRTLARQFDSGVWMDKESEAENSEGEGVEEEDLLERAASSSSSPSSPPAPPPPALLCAPAHSAPLLPPPQRQRRVFQRVPSLAVDAAEAKARAVVQACIEAGEEEVSLMGLGLGALSSATVEPLSGLVPIPVVAPGVAFEQKDPELKLFLSSNQLTRLPGALFDLGHLTVLSLRGNALAELPPALGRLRALRSLNVSLNALRCLPAELLPLLRATGRGGRLVELLAHPNPYYARQGAAAAAAAAATTTTTTTTEAVPRPARVARSPVRYMDSTGNTWSSFAMEPVPAAAATAAADADTEADADTDADVIPVEYTPPVPPGSLSRVTTPPTASRVPTLVELALEACYRAPRLAQLPALLPCDAPAHLGRMLAGVQALRDAGGRACSVCGRAAPLVAPMTEWLEWWAFAPADLNASYAATPGAAEGADAEVAELPFMWRGCSWGCVPQ